MSKWNRARNYILRTHDGDVAVSRRRRADLHITQNDYWPVPIPLNLQFPIPQHCLIWRWSLNKDGYGKIAAHGESRLAHRVAYEQSGRVLGDADNVLHACHRRFCIQPAHLYLGSEKDNATDRLAYGGKMEPQFLRQSFPIGYIGSVEFVRQLNQDPQVKTILEYVTDRHKRIDEASTHWWPDPENLPQQPKLDHPSQDDCPAHEFTVPAGDCHLCWICRQPQVWSSDHTAANGR